MDKQETKNDTKVICIGWHKTGTSTIGMALIKLGYSVVGARLDTTDDLFAGNIEKVLTLAREFDALQDVPWAALFKQLDERYPGSKFILTIRDENRWLNSAKKHFNDGYSKLRKWLYGKGILEGNEQIYLNRYRQHNREVLEYFENRQNDLLVMNFENEDGWERLCPFLGHSIPKNSFPHVNKGKHSYNRKDKLVHRLREWTPDYIRQVIFQTKLTLLKPFGYSDPRNRFNNFPENRDERRKWEKQRAQKA